MRRCRNQGTFFQQNAFEYFVSAEQHVAPGNTNFLVEINSSGDRKVGKERQCVAGIRNFGLFSVDDEKQTITFWKSLDYIESEKSMKAGGHAVGYGPGLVIPLEEFNAVHRTREKLTMIVK